MKIDLDDFVKFDVDNMDALVVLYQTGYLTISKYDTHKEKFELDYPNEEVRSSFMKSLIDLYLETPKMNAKALIYDLPDALNEGNIDEAMELLQQFMASIPYEITSSIEFYYQTVVHIVFSMFGLRCQSEVRTSSGRIDAIVETKDFIYCFEFKIDKSAQEALAQIDEKEYLLPYKNKGKKLFSVGVNFDTIKRTVGEWVYKE
jgi:hypothetical protein